MDNTVRKKILVVDDDKLFIATMEYWLKSRDYEVKTANDGLTALEAAKGFNPNLILLDVNMPGIDGIETLKRLREFDKETPVIIITAFIGEDRVAAASP
ncbi:MAG: response regulator, partial [Candidatus Omnitrophota bacterium]